MFRSTIFVTILLVAVIDSEKNVPALRANSDLDKDQRELQIQLGDDICPPLENLFRNLVECECDVSVDYPLVETYADVKCGRTICDPIADVACADVTFKTNLTLGPVAVGAAVCVEDIALFGFIVPGLGPFCIDYVTGRDGKSKKKSVVKSCKANLGGTECNSCTPCDKKGGVQLDCTNTVRSFKTDRCAIFRPYLGTGSTPDAKIPKIFKKK
jgi:hypothetical protein